jgi:hypothetical protein
MYCPSKPHAETRDYLLSAFFIPSSRNQECIGNALKPWNEDIEAVQAIQRYLQ